MKWVEALKVYNQHLKDDLDLDTVWAIPRKGTAERQHVQMIMDSDKHKTSKKVRGLPHLETRIVPVKEEVKKVKEVETSSAPKRIFTRRKVEETKEEPKTATKRVIRRPVAPPVAKVQEESEESLLTKYKDYKQIAEDKSQPEELRTASKELLDRVIETMKARGIALPKPTKRFIKRPAKEEKAKEPESESDKETELVIPVGEKNAIRVTSDRYIEIPKSDKRITPDRYEKIVEGIKKHAPDYVYVYKTKSGNIKMTKEKKEAPKKEVPKKEAPKKEPESESESESEGERPKPKQTVFEYEKKYESPQDDPLYHLRAVKDQKKVKEEIQEAVDWINNSMTRIYVDGAEKVYGYFYQSDAETDGNTGNRDNRLLRFSQPYDRAPFVKYIVQFIKDHSVQPTGVLSKYGKYISDHNLGRLIRLESSPSSSETTKVVEDTKKKDFNVPRDFQDELTLRWNQIQFILPKLKTDRDKLTVSTARLTLIQLEGAPYLSKIVGGYNTYGRTKSAPKTLYELDFNYPGARSPTMLDKKRTGPHFGSFNARGTDLLNAIQQVGFQIDTRVLDSNGSYKVYMTPKEQLIRFELISGDVPTRGEFPDKKLVAKLESEEKAKSKK